MIRKGSFRPISLGDSRLTPRAKMKDGKWNYPGRERWEKSRRGTKSLGKC